MSKLGLGICSCMYKYLLIIITNIKLDILKIGGENMEKTIDQLILDLKDDDEFVREEAKAMIELKGDEAIEPLIAALSNRSKDIKMAAASILGMKKTEEAIDALVKTLNDPNKLVRKEASTALTQMGSAAVGPVKEVLKSPDWRVRGAAVWILGSLKDQSVIPDIEGLVDDESAFVRSGVKFALEELNNS